MNKEYLIKLLSDQGYPIEGCEEIIDEVILECHSQEDEDYIDMFIELKAEYIDLLAEE